LTTNADGASTGGELARARQAFEDAEDEFVALAGTLALGRVDEDAVLRARQNREDARAHLEVWEAGMPAIHATQRSRDADRLGGAGAPFSTARSAFSLSIAARSARS
jgi:hypothetical protein